MRTGEPDIDGLVAPAICPESRGGLLSIPTLARARQYGSLASLHTPLNPGYSMRVELTVKSKSVRNEEMANCVGPSMS